MSQVDVASTARAQGRDRWWKKSSADNPYKPGTLESYCWSAGRAQDVRHPEQLLRDWQAGRT